MSVFVSFAFPSKGRTQAPEREMRPDYVSRSGSEQELRRASCDMQARCNLQGIVEYWVTAFQTHGSGRLGNSSD